MVGGRTSGGAEGWASAGPASKAPSTVAMTRRRMIIPSDRTDPVLLSDGRGGAGQENRSAEFPSRRWLALAIFHSCAHNTVTLPASPASYPTCLALSEDPPHANPLLLLAFPPRHGHHGCAVGVRG